MREVVRLGAEAGEHPKAYTLVEHAVAEGVAARLGADAGRDLYPRLVAGALMSAIRVTLEHWRQTGAARPLPDVLRDSLDQVAAGLPVPAEWGK